MGTRGALNKNRVNPAAIDALMERSGFNARTLAEACEPPVHRTAITNVIAGRRQPSADLSVRIARALKVPLVAILADPEDMP